MSLDPVDRAMLVTLMSGFGASRNGSPYVPRRQRGQAPSSHRPWAASWTRREAGPTLPDGIDLEQWRHLATLGRDHYVRVVYAGWLCPFGHAASL